MDSSELKYFISPVTKLPLTLDAAMNVLHTEAGEEFGILDGIPDFVPAEGLAAKARQAQSFYDDRSENYDQYLHLTFYTHGEDEGDVRNRLVDNLELKTDSKVLEIAAGSGRDSVIIASRLDASGLLCLQDISAGMLAKARAKLTDVKVPVSYSLSDATSLPYSDNSFDAVFSFGGLGEFPDIAKALSEMVRVCRPGGKVVVGDESIPVWLRKTEFAKILTTTNPQFMAPLPLEHLPVEAREVCVRWIIGGVFYTIDFRVAEGDPSGNFDYPIPGPRGGTLRSRYLGQLEGVSVETKDLAHKARLKKGLSMHDWLESAVREAAERDLQ